MVHCGVLWGRLEVWRSLGRLGAVSGRFLTLLERMRNFVRFEVGKVRLLAGHVAGSCRSGAGAKFEHPSSWSDYSLTFTGALWFHYGFALVSLCFIVCRFGFAVIVLCGLWHFLLGLSARSMNMSDE